MRVTAGGEVIQASPRPANHQPSAISSQPEPLNIKATSAPRRGRHITAQGRDHRSRTLGERPVRERTLKGFHTSRVRCTTPSGLGRTTAHFPGCAPASRPWAVMDNPFGVQRGTEGRKRVGHLVHLGPEKSLTAWPVGVAERIASPSWRSPVTTPPNIIG